MSFKLRDDAFVLFRKIIAYFLFWNKKVYRVYNKDAIRMLFVYEYNAIRLF
jgi:hypothetical protein